MLAADGRGAVIADDVANDADVVSIPCGNATFGVVGQYIAFDQVMATDEDVLVGSFGGDQPRGFPGFAAAVDSPGGGVADDVVADNPVLPTAGAEGAKLREPG